MMRPALQMLLGRAVGSSSSPVAPAAAAAAARRALSVTTGATGAAGEDDTQQRTTETSSLTDSAPEGSPASDAGGGASFAPPPPPTMTGERVFEAGAAGASATARPPHPSKSTKDPSSFGPAGGVKAAEEERIGEGGGLGATAGGAVGAAVDAVKGVGHKVADAARHAAEAIGTATTAAPRGGFSGPNRGDTSGSAAAEVWENLQRSQADPGAGVDSGAPAARHGGGREGGEDRAGTGTSDGRTATP